ncbi:DUF4124 domain-containing protein [Microbulbifer sp. JMSA004]|uniref:DUF4124 domain-containing protein n=1 Tax=unclassified Microbulbifer TaxID=2619833 RepID=UPI0024AC9981|nr:DUF4124 domain-containing protein [Microbulbifer sp. VAAF005]WHI45124.1 DUF4124 domain-containing protein [Microbulbifer sp. VAAF005]
MKLQYLSSIFGGLLLAANVSAGELYRWVDEDGRVHFGDRPPAHADAKNVSGNLTPINSADATTAPQRSQSKQPRNIEQQYQERLNREAQERRQQVDKACSEARKDLEILRGRVIFLDDNGKEIRRTEREREQMAEDYQRQVNLYCG